MIKCNFMRNIIMVLIMQFLPTFCYFVSFVCITYRKVSATIKPVPIVFLYQCHRLYKRHLGRTQESVQFNGISCSFTLPLGCCRVWLTMMLRRQVLYFRRMDSTIFDSTLFDLTLFDSTLQKYAWILAEKMVEALCYKPEGSEFDSRLGHWIFQLT
jgi:hypothetical protein